MSYIEDFEEIFFDLEDEPDLKHEDTKPHEKTKKTKKNNFFNDSDLDLICLLLCGSLFVFLLDFALIDYTIYYFSK